MLHCWSCCFFFFFFQAEDGIRDTSVTGVQTCALPICGPARRRAAAHVRSGRSVRGGRRRYGMTDRGGFEGLDSCVHCGFCLQACPTFLATGDESDSPRGRIELMRALEAGELAPTDPGVALHLDRCLGCRGCEPVCPSGVSYGRGLEAARALLTERRGVSPLVRAALGALTGPGGGSRTPAAPARPAP